MGHPDDHVLICALAPVPGIPVLAIWACSTALIRKNRVKTVMRCRIFFVEGSFTAPGERRTQDIDELLAAWSKGDEEALKDLVSRLYPELRRIARRHLARRSGDSLESAALANEAYLKLSQARGVLCDSRVHFLAVCAQMIRRILVDYARARHSAKRGGDAPRVALDETLLGMRTRGVEVLALNEALASLSKIDPRKGRVVELRYFAGLSVEETAEVLKTSAETVLRDWKIAKAWLLRELTSA
jgi:RNA polymerase sigma factor (TIGR02999 family)